MSSFLKTEPTINENLIQNSWKRGQIAKDKFSQAWHLAFAVLKAENMSKSKSKPGLAN